MNIESFYILSGFVETGGLTAKWRLSPPLASGETEAVVCEEGLILGWMMKVPKASTAKSQRES